MSEQKMVQITEIGGRPYAVCLDEEDEAYGYLHYRCSCGVWDPERQATEDEMAMAKEISAKDE